MPNASQIRRSHVENDANLIVLAKLREALDALQASRDSALNDIEELRRGVSDTEAALQKIDNEMGSIRNMIERFSRTANIGSHDVPSDFGARRRERKTSLAWKVRRAAYAAIVELGRPIKRAEMLEQVRLRGISIDSDDPLRTVGKILYDAPEFIRSREGYTLTPSTSSDRTKDLTSQEVGSISETQT
jgi:hypothetical protein